MFLLVKLPECVSVRQSDQGILSILYIKDSLIKLENGDSRFMSFSMQVYESQW